jgi:hypothetical protein
MPVRNRLYIALMALCLALFVLSWAVVRLYSVTAAVDLQGHLYHGPPAVHLRSRSARL